MSGRLDGKVCLVSAAANGIGGAITRRFAQEGARTVVCDIDGPGLAALVDDLRGRGADIIGMAGDASDPAFVASWVAAAIEAHGGIDVLSNNVGVSRPGLVADISDDDWRFQQRLTLDTVFYATRAVLPHLVRRGGGSIISMSSGAGIGGNYNLGAYAAAKAGVINLMETVATEYGLQGVRANAVTPGPTATAPLAAYYAEHPDALTELASALDLGRLSRPEEVANTVLWLASDESSNITGICVRSNIRAASSRARGS
jgi:meso-butanediol dehydrogenase/(S,S)-butanediol dehydrogenase/diacetyl reductase